MQRPLIVEAGTGTGKTLAYLVPALLSGKRVVVSTGTRALQDQIARHDMPLLRTIVAQAVHRGRAEGRRELRVPAQARRARASERGAARTDVSVDALVDWAEHTETGDRAEVEWLAEDAPLWTEVDDDARCADRPALPVLRALLRHPGAPARRARRS